MLAAAIEHDWDKTSDRWPENLTVAAYRIKRESPLRVPDLILRSIGFVAEVNGDDLSTANIDPVGTVFLVSIPSSEIPGGRFCYAITARHVLDEATPNTERVIVVNRRGGGVAFLTLLSEWLGHPDASVDVAALPVKYDASVDVSMFDLEDLFDESNNRENIGPGDEVFFPGLFTPAPGHERVMPMVRHGNLAMLPNQQIQTSEGYQDIYLIEARSIGGFSGSPVFVRETVVLPVSRGDGEGEQVMQGLGKFKLLGLIKAHWDVEESKINQAHVLHSPKRGVNMGVAQVVPVKKILETLERPEFKAMRHGAESAYLSQMDGSND